MLIHEKKSLTICMEERGRSFSKRKIQPAAKLGKTHEHSICSLCSQRSVKLPHRDTWLLAQHLIYLSPVILLRRRTPRASNPFLGRQCWCWSSCWYLARVNDLGPHPRVQLSGIPGSGTAPGAWPWASAAHRSWKENVPCPQRSRRVTWILHCWRFQGEHCGTGGHTGRRNYPSAAHDKTSYWWAAIKNIQH